MRKENGKKMERKRSATMENGVEKEGKRINRETRRRGRG